MYPNSATSLHIELTDKCQAACPMCARNISGGADRPFVGNSEITLAKFKEWFTSDFLKGLTKFYACGNYGDPIIAQDCLEIYKHVRSVNPNCVLSMNTNGSARTEDWWTELASVMKEGDKVLFGIDGFEDSHVLYRRGTSWSKIISNATAFIKAGGNAYIDCLVFKHNQHEVDVFRKEMLNLGFKDVNFKYTRRFYGMQQFPVKDKLGQVEYFLEPAIDEQPLLPLNVLSKDTSKWATIVETSNVNPACLKQNEIYVDARGNVFPCCWIGSDWVEEFIEETVPLQTLRNAVVRNTQTLFAEVGIPNLNDVSLDKVNWNNFNSFLKENKPWTCVKNCNG